MAKLLLQKKLAKELNIPIVSTDEVRNLHPNANEDHIWPLVYEACGAFLTKEQDFIFDATNITPNVRKRFKDRMNQYQIDYQIGTYYFDVDPHICFNRAIIRNKMPEERYIPPEVILSYGEKIIPPRDDEGFIFRKVIKDDL